MSLGAFYVLCRWLHFAALMSLVGSSACIVLLAPGRFRDYLAGRFNRLIGASTALTLLTAVLLLAAQTGLMGSGWEDIMNADVWLSVLQTRFGRAWQWQLIAGLLGVFALNVRSRMRETLLLLSGAGQLAGLAFVGHTAMLDGGLGVIQRANQMVHLLSSAFWTGGLLPVVMLMHDARHHSTRYDALRTLMRFSRYGHLAVALVIISGIINTLLLLGWPLASFQLYSQLLLIKALLAAAMCGVALFNRYWLVPRFQRSGENAQHRFIRATLAELLLAAFVLLLVSVFATLEPA